MADQTKGVRCYTIAELRLQGTPDEIEDDDPVLIDAKTLLVSPRKEDDVAVELVFYKMGASSKTQLSRLHVQCRFPAKAVKEMFDQDGRGKAVMLARSLLGILSNLSEADLARAIEQAVDNHFRGR
jgi:hypothetical protein